MTQGQDGFPEALAGRFRPLRRLGAGAMGTVHLCEDSELGRKVAVKLMQGAAEGERRRRFLREAEAMASVDHPNALKVFDHGLLEDGTPYLVVEYLEGQSLEEVSDLPDPLATVLPIAEALERCHEAGMIHRDVKPANLFLTDDGRPVLLDFGLAKPLDRTALTRTGHIVGTPVYLAPEALRGEEPTPAWDWYALGVTLFALAEERLPYETRDLVEWMGDPDLRPAFRFERVAPARATRALMADDPAARPRSSEALEAAARSPAPAPASRGSGSGARTAVVESEGIAAAPVAPPARRMPPAALAAWLFLLVGVGWWWGPAPMGPDAPGDRAGAPADASATPGIPPEPQEPRLLEPLGVNAAGHREFRNIRTGSVMILVPAGPFVSRASDDVETPGPARQVRLGAFLIGKTEVSVEDYWRFGYQAGNRPQSGLKHGDDGEFARRPMIRLTWHEARRYCEWAGGRLPTALEWERAAGGPEGWTYPWGEDPPRPELASYGGGNLQWVLTPERFMEDVGSFPAGASPVGALDMAGNIYEWTSDVHEPTADDPTPDRVMKGGNAYSEGIQMRTWHRRGWAPNVPEAIGFRLAMDVPPGLLTEEATR